MGNGRYERELVNAFQSRDWGAFRLAASGGGATHDLPDIMAANGEQIYAIELKTRAEPKNPTTYCHAPLEDLDAITRFAQTFTAKPRVATRWKGQPDQWGFAHPDEIEQTETKFRWNQQQSWEWPSLEDLG